MVQDLNPAPPVVTFSKNSLTQVEDTSGYLGSILMQESLSVFQPTGVPPHELTLKENDICLLTRNLQRRTGLTTNARVRILQINTNYIRVQTLTSPPKHALIPRIRFKFRLNNLCGYEVTRIQFPLRLAYAMTYNKSQGQTLQQVLLDITHPPFSHGHLYVALSRVTHYSKIRVYCNDTDLLEGTPTLHNVTYPSALR
jgi:hypothetical protein